MASPKSTSANPNPTASLGSPLMTPGWPLASVASANPTCVAGDSPTPDATKTTNKVQASILAAGLASKRID
jgi:hypothetical protein